jgi:hypothetical protein
MPQPNDLSRSLVALDQNSTIIAVIEMSQSSYRRAVHRHVGIVPIRVRVRKIVAAAMGEPIDVPIALDELQDRDMVGIAAVQGKTAIAKLAESVLRRISRIIGPVMCRRAS